MSELAGYNRLRCVILSPDSLARRVALTYEFMGLISHSYPVGHSPVLASKAFPSAMFRVDSLSMNDAICHAKVHKYLIHVEFKPNPCINITWWLILYVLADFE